MISRVLAAIGLAAVTLVFLYGCGSASPVPPADGQAGVDTITWTNPSLWEDGSPLTADQLDDILIQWGNNPNGPFNEGSQTVVAGNPGSTQSITVERQVLGNRCYVAFAIADGISSVSTAAVCKQIRGRPNPPSGLGVD